MRLADPARANAAIQEAADAAVRAGEEIGIQVAAYVGEELVVDVSAGTADPATGRAVTRETVFPVFSVSKAVTAVALHIQAERGLVDCEAPIARYWPEFGRHGKELGTVRDALTHRLGVPQLPDDVTPERMCDWKWMVEAIADLRPLFPPGSRSAYLAYTFGWILGEIVRRTDPQQRPFGRFVAEEICRPLGIDALWLGIPDEVEPRVARLQNLPSAAVGTVPPEALFPVAIPPQVDTCQEVFGRPDVRRACIPAAGGIMNAPSCARLFALLANRGALGGVRLLSPERIEAMTVPRPVVFEFDTVVWTVLKIGMGALYLGGDTPIGPSPVGSNVRTLWHGGAGGSMGWADPDVRVAVALLHNKMCGPPMLEEPALIRIARNVREVLGLAD